MKSVYEFGERKVGKEIELLMTNVGNSHEYVV